MKKIFFTVGPTALYPQIKEYINQGIEENIFSQNHRSKEFTDVVRDTVTELKELLNIPDNFQIFFLSSGTECMERIIENLVEEKSLHFVNGFFAERFYNIARQLKKNAEAVKTDFGYSFEFDKINIPFNSELFCFVQNETSTGVALKMNEIYELKKRFPEVIFAVDVVSSVPFVNIDFNFIDVAFFSVQKGFGMPSGMGIVIINKKCIEKTKYLREQNLNIGTYHNFINLSSNAENFQTAMTPNMLAIYLCGKVSEYLNKTGREKIRNETEIKAKMIYDFFEKNKFISPFVKDPSDRSMTTLVFNVNGNADEIIKKLDEKGFVISRGYKDFRDSQIRIGNFPMHTTEDVTNLLNVFNSFI